MSAERERQLLLWSVVGACSTVAAAAALAWATKKAVDNYIPYQYHYRPGTLSGWLASALNKYSKRRRRARPVRVYMDGCFDMMHFGHCNALRQAKALGDVLVVGLIPDSEIVRCKGPPVLNEQERYVLVDAVKWVDEIITGVPYDLSPDFVEELFTKHKIDYIIHGDDPCLLPDGTDAYAHAKKLGRFKMIKRTEGVSTTDIVGRMLTCTRTNSLVSKESQQMTRALTRHFSEAHRHSSSSDEEEGDEQPSTSTSNSGHGNAAAKKLARAPTPRRDHRVAVSQFMPTSRRLVQFSEGKSASEGASIVYIDGAFDVFHPGHVEILKAAKAQGDFLMVGLHTDEDVQARRGPHLPIMNVHERALSVLACKYVDEIIIGAPVVITENLLKTFNISRVARGTLSETSSLGPVEPERYQVPRARGIFVELVSPNNTTTSEIINRIVDNRKAYEARNAKKVKSEEAYYGAQGAFVKEV